MKKLLLVVALLLVSSTAYAQDGYIELLRSDIRTEKIAIITEVMQLEGEQSEAFWAVYKEYDHAMSKINDIRVAMIKDYAENFDKITDEKALEIAATWFEFQENRMALRKEYFKEFQEVLPAAAAAKFLQLDHQISLLIDLQVAAAIPLIQPKGD
jgi:hypothetical protein